MDMDTLYTHDQVIDLLIHKYHVTNSKQMVLRWIRQGELKSLKFGKGYLISEPDLQQFLDKKQPAIRIYKQKHEHIKAEIHAIMDYIGEQKAMFERSSKSDKDVYAQFTFEELTRFANDILDQLQRIPIKRE